MVVATAGHKSDIDVVIQPCALNPPIWLPGFAPQDRLCARPPGAGGFTQGQIDELHLPIGVAIEAEDPEEIAISIAAEMIHLRRTKLVPRKR